MNVRVQTQVLPPRMQHTNGPGFNPIVAVAKSLQHASGAFKQCAVKPFAVQQTYLVQRFGNGKHYMEVFHIHGIVHPVICPDCLFV